jgi:pyruvate formate-lyase/glycerol dehydratase family glycyl radical enzyme
MIAESKIDMGLLQKIDNVQLSERLSRLKNAMFSAPRKISVSRAKLAMESWKETEGEDIEIRRAKLFKHVLDNVPIDIYDFDSVVGRETEHLLGVQAFLDETGDAIPWLWDKDDRVVNMLFQGISKEEKDTLRECARFFAGKTAPDHVQDAWRSIVGTWAQDVCEASGRDPAPDSGYFPGITIKARWEYVLSKGLRGLIEEAEAGMRSFEETKETDMNKFYFWQSAIIVCQAVIDYAHRYAKLAHQMAAKEQNAERRRDLEEIAEVCEWVPENPARSFHEALQFMNFLVMCRGLEAIYPLLLGRIDQYLWPYFEKDIHEGRLTIERAAELLGNSIALWGMKVGIQTGKTQQKTHQYSFMINSLNVSGLDREGKDATNELSYLTLHMMGLLNLSSPTVNFAWHSNTPKWLLLKALETNMKTKGGIPLFENSEYVVKHFVDDGYSAEEARDWYGQGCVTPVLPDRIDHTGSEGKGAINVALMLELALHNGLSVLTGKRIGLETGDPRDFKTFNDLYEAFKKQHEFVTTRCLWLGTVAQSVEPQYLRFPFTSCISGPGCLKKGQDQIIPDSDHSYGISDRAIVDTADSLIAVKKLVFDEKTLTMDELLKALDTNFEGKRGEEIRQLCLAAPKFGNDIDEVDLMVRDVGIFSGSIFSAYKNPFNVPVKLSREGMSWHVWGGAGLGALPNGRKAKEPLNDGSISPMRGMDKLGPTGVLRSVLKAGFDESYATVLNQKFSGTVMQSLESREKLSVLTDTFFRNGGQHIQFNLVDTEELLDAKANPEKHRDLVVRVGGFSAYFVMLSEEVQDDIIARSEQGC